MSNIVIKYSSPPSGELRRVTVARESLTYDYIVALAPTAEKIYYRDDDQDEVILDSETALAEALSVLHCGKLLLKFVDATPKAAPPSYDASTKQRAPVTTSDASELVALAVATAERAGVADDVEFVAETGPALRVARQAAPAHVTVLGAPFLERLAAAKASGGAEAAEALLTRRLAFDAERKNRKLQAFEAKQQRRVDKFEQRLEKVAVKQAAAPPASAHEARLKQREERLMAKVAKQQEIIARQRAKLAEKTDKREAKDAAKGKWAPPPFARGRGGFAARGGFGGGPLAC